MDTIFSKFKFLVLEPKGTVALQEKEVLIMATLLMALVVIPVLILLFVFAWKYQAGNKNAKHSPNLKSHPIVTTFLCAIPVLIIGLVGMLNWHSTHSLDPYKPMSSETKPINIQVVALEWKWLFIYPEYNIATVNFVQFPVDTPINFELTSDAPMNSFWIPELGGQMYAMSGMSTKLHLMASEISNFNGGAAEINGKGFSGMKFVAKSTSQDDFDQLVDLVVQTKNNLTYDTYTQLAQQSENNPVAYFTNVENGLYNMILMKFMVPEVHTNLHVTE